MSERPTIVAPTPEEDAEIVAAALADPDARPLTDPQLVAMTPMPVFRSRPRAKGRKILLSVRYSPEVIA